MSLLRSETGKIHIGGHRGHSAGAPENTLAAFRAAQALGGTVCEIDLVLSSDGELVLVHDDTLDRTTSGKGLVSSKTLAELRALDAGSWFSAEFAGEKIPTFRETLELARSIGIMLQVELKLLDRDDEFFPKIAAMLEEMDAYDLVQFSSFDFRQLRRVKREIPKVPTVGLSWSRLVDPVAVARDANLDAMNIELHHFPAGEALQLHEGGIAVFLAVPRPAVFARMAEYGKDMETPIVRWLEEGQIDQLLGDDVGFVARLVGGEG